MNERIEAAAKAHWEADCGASWDDHTTEDYRERLFGCMGSALAAADAVMFSEDTIEAIYDEFRLTPPQMRWLVGLLKGAGNE